MDALSESVPEIPSPEEPNPVPFPDQAPHDVPDPGPQGAGRDSAVRISRDPMRPRSATRRR
jgi:hypothetical protein